jgi:hypothetical protein
MVCTFPDSQTNINKANLALCEIGKPPTTYIKYRTTLTNPSALPFKDFKIDMYFDTVSLVSLKVSFFVIVIKQQVTPFLDSIKSSKRII